MFYTNSQREISYFGIENGERILRKDPDPSKKIQNLNDLFRFLLKAWAKKTAYPSSQKDPNFSIDNDPTFGQCAITATLVYDLFGGSIHKINVPGGGSHYFNRINGVYIDLTSDQFSLYGIPIIYEPNQEISREFCGRNPNTNSRFQLLRSRLKNAIL